MRYLTPLLLSLTIAGSLATASPADAQSIIVPLPACVDRPLLGTMPVPVAPSGIPEPFRLSVSPPDPAIPVCSTVIEVNEIGGAAAVWCVAPSKAPELSLYAVRWAAVTPGMVSDFAQLGLPGNSRERIRAMQAKYQTANVLDMCDVWGPARDRINAAMPAALPRPLWTVAKFSVQTTRPSYALTAGARGLASTGRAPVGAACDCSAPIVEGVVTYCPFAGSAGAVTVCSKP